MLAAALTACASTSSITSRYLAPSVAPSASITLAAQTPEQSIRERYETVCAGELGTKVTVIPAYTLLSSWAGASPEPLLAVTDTPALLVIDLTSLLLPAMQMPPGNEVSDARLGSAAGPTYNTWELGSSRSQDSADVDQVIHVEARLISQSGTTLWEGIIHTHEANDLRAIAQSQCRALADTLGAHGLLH